MVTSYSAEWKSLRSPSPDHDHPAHHRDTPSGVLDGREIHWAADRAARAASADRAQPLALLGDLAGCRAGDYGLAALSNNSRHLLQPGKQPPASSGQLDLR